MSWEHRARTFKAYGEGWDEELPRLTGLVGAPVEAVIRRRESVAGRRKSRRDGQAIRRGRSLMILVRTWFRTKWGAASTVVELLKGISATLEPDRRARIYTDLSGELFTVTWETEWPNLSAYEAAFEELRQSDGYRELMTEIVDLVETGGRDYLLRRWPET